MNETNMFTVQIKNAALSIIKIEVLFMKIWALRKKQYGFYCHEQILNDVSRAA